MEPVHSATISVNESEPLDLSEFDFLIEFETCNGDNELLSGEVYKARYRYHTNEAQALADEIIDINEFFYRATINVDIPDYVEIINVTEETKDLSNWTIETGSGEHNLNQFNIELLPQSLILCSLSPSIAFDKSTLINSNFKSSSLILLT